ncbi:DUF2188 domain-containing protein [Neotabrizicola sp. VNH66]|uniref:DUF2188 domain-containing protein n=1 Tax=Neotabrizicola sp. VNH66 TaxID=3400918 RepID=UPI003BFC2277
MHGLGAVLNRSQFEPVRGRALVDQIKVGEGRDRHLARLGLRIGVHDQFHPAPSRHEGVAFPGGEIHRGRTFAGAIPRATGGNLTGPQGREPERLEAVQFGHRRAGHKAVRRGGAARSSGHFDTKQDAVQRAREISRNADNELKIHNRDGRIAQSDSSCHLSG